MATTRIQGALVFAVLLCGFAVPAMAGGHRRDVVVVAPSAVIVPAPVQTVYVQSAPTTYLVRERPVYATGAVIVRDPYVQPTQTIVVRERPVYATEAVVVEPAPRVVRLAPTTVVVPTGAIVASPSYLVPTTRMRVVVPRQVYRLGY